MDFVKDYFEKLSKELETIKKEDIEKVVKILFDAWREEKQIFIFGNGGSASTSSHFACDLGKGTLGNTYDDKGKRFRVISLSDNISIMTAFANDLSYDDIFSQQLNNLVNPGDVVLVLTGSGNSKNIIKGIEAAKGNKAITIAFLGFDGGKVKDIVDHYILFKSDHYGRIEDSHLILEHLICSYLKEKIGNK